MAFDPRTAPILRAALAAGLITLAASGAGAVNPDEILADPALEGRAREISQNLRCVVCQNQSIDDSDAELARDLRVMVRERLVQGDSNAQVIDFVTSRYGDFVLLNPPFKAKTYLLWFGPALIFAGALWGAAAFYRRQRASAEAAAASAPLSAEETRRANALLEE